MNKSVPGTLSRYAMELEEFISTNLQQGTYHIDLQC